MSWLSQRTLHLPNLFISLSPSLLAPFHVPSREIPRYFRFVQLHFVEQFSSLFCRAMQPSLFSHDASLPCPGTSSPHLQRRNIVFSNWSLYFKFPQLDDEKNHISIGYCEDSMRWCLVGTQNSTWYMVGPQLMLTIASYWHLQYYLVSLFWRLETKCVKWGLSHGKHVKTCKCVNTYRALSLCQAFFYLCTFHIHDNQKRESGFSYPHFTDEEPKAYRG